jgi:predicted CXXCH cytochrome family protein
MIRRWAIIFSIFAALLIMGIAAMLVFQPQSASALNPNHNCDTCHNLHQGQGQVLLNYTVTEDLCLSCHGPAGTSSLKADVHTNKSGSSYPAFTMTCMDCHNPHDSRQNYLGGTNIKMVGRREDASGNAKINTPNSGIRDVVFESRGTDLSQPSLHSFADNDEDNNGIYDGACEVCHTQAANHRNNSGGNHAHYTGQTCTQCHGHDGGFLATGGGCTACHGSPQDKGDGPPTRRAMVGEFSLTSHHVLGGTVTDDDCGVCHYEAVDGAYHQNNQVDLRNPDDASVGALIQFAQFSRNTSSETLESWVTDVQDNFCLKCHDSDGATQTNFSGNALQPFSASHRDVPNIFAKFDPANTDHHAVRGSGNNDYCIPSAANGSNITMEPPWNQDANHDVISCFDCHGTSGHGSSNQRNLRVAIDFDGMIAAYQAGDWQLIPAGVGTAAENFCTICHKSSVYFATDPGAAGSVFENHPGDIGQHAAAGQNPLGCLGCHAAPVQFNNNVPPSGNGGAPGIIHGATFVWPTGTWADGFTTESFMLGGWISGWSWEYDSRKDVYYGQCGGGDCNHTGSDRNNGQSYTR